MVAAIRGSNGDNHGQDYLCSLVHNRGRDHTVGVVGILTSTLRSCLHSTTLNVLIIFLIRIVQIIGRLKGFSASARS